MASGPRSLPWSLVPGPWGGWGGIPGLWSQVLSWGAEGGVSPPFTSHPSPNQDQDRLPPSLPPPQPDPRQGYSLTLLRWYAFCGHVGRLSCNLLIISKFYPSCFLAIFFMEIQTKMYLQNVHCSICYGPKTEKFSRRNICSCYISG